MCKTCGILFLLQCEKLVDPDSGIEGQPACDLRAVGKKFDKGLYTTLVSPHHNVGWGYAGKELARTKCLTKPEIKCVVTSWKAFTVLHMLVHTNSERKSCLNNEERGLKGAQTNTYSGVLK